MCNESVIPYDLVATKMNHWYVALKNNWVEKAKKMKAEVKQEINLMEENQDALVYFSLLEFRHELMLDYLYPNANRDIHQQCEALKKTKGNRDLTGMLEYYYHFFMGMYYFRQNELVHSLRCYRQAERELEYVEDQDVERAEFYFKISEIFYYMKQTYFSMHYAKMAYELYRNQPTYGVRQVHCQFVIVGNWLDNMRHDRALKHAYQALEDAKKIGENYLIRKSLFNIGICYDKLEEPSKSSHFFMKSLEIEEPENLNFQARAWYMLSLVEGKQSNLDKAKEFYRKAKKIAKKCDDKVILAKLKMVKGLYLSRDLDLIRETFEFFKETQMYPDMEWYGVCVGDHLTNQKELKGANEFYRRAIDARIQIQRGELVHES
ncbi:tetratricopeptide repeat protein [Bacillus sonorensis]|uniref:response regulator aspartate phosphatase n=1 Tax=Bacillus sonorensis TaxID=119858 RepID=UPI0022828E3A|nr:tetratricopeptide repeat protein [Bacillus sonorensis]MCY8087234.1 tetratricopeptide repeat protein [Bacillus sonorensis]MCZ0069552.1 tetratricopeptide repeat protein [Bacillus sonorensis]MCZ0096941.1 tetratricopeptide repeat protein [Bacillus sonorensis]MEC1517619.1 tetratricopeptide repeat protein [Bacillus sonorensis]